MKSKKRLKKCLYMFSGSWCVLATLYGDTRRAKLTLLTGWNGNGRGKIRGGRDTDVRRKGAEGLTSNFEVDAPAGGEERAETAYGADVVGMGAVGLQVGEVGKGAYESDIETLSRIGVETYLEARDGLG